MARKTKGEVGKAVSQLEELFKTRKILDYSERDLAELVGLTEKTVRSHLNSIKSKVGSRTIDSITQTFIDDLDIMMTDLRYYWKQAKEQEDEKRILFYTNRMFKAWDQFADLLERFGIKQKVADKMDLTAEVTSKSISIQIIDDRSQIKQIEQ